MSAQKLAVAPETKSALDSSLWGPKLSMFQRMLFQLETLTSLNGQFIINSTKEAFSQPSKIRSRFLGFFAAGINLKCTPLHSKRSDSQ